MRNVLAPKSVRVGIDEREVVMIVDGDAFLKMPADAARKVAHAMIRNANILEVHDADARPIANAQNVS